MNKQKPETKTKRAKLEVNFPNGYFTVEDLQNLYKDAVNITLRFKLTKAKESKRVVTIGTIKRDIGRPQLIFAKKPISNETLIKANNVKEITLDSEYAVQVVEALKIRNTSKKEDVEETQKVETSEHASV